MKKIILITIISFLFVSCWVEEKNSIQNSSSWIIKWKIDINNTENTKKLWKGEISKTAKLDIETNTKWDCINFQNGKCLDVKYIETNTKWDCINFQNGKCLDVKVKNNAK